VAQGALFYEFSLERHVPEDHLVRSVDRFVDLCDVRGRLAPLYSWTPAITPWLGARFIAELALGRMDANDLPGSPGSGVDFPPFGRRHPVTARRSWKIRRSKL
jgi:hypothetical protein